MSAGRAPVTTLLVLLALSLASAAGATAARAETPDEAIRALSLPVGDLVYDPLRQRLYASVSSADPQRGNSIAVIDPASGEIETAVAVGSEPSRLALSDDGSVLYVGLDGTAAVRPVDVSAAGTLTPRPPFSLGTDPNFRIPLVAGDLAVMPGAPGTVAVSLRLSQGGFAGVRIYDLAGTTVHQRPAALDSYPESNTIAFADAGRLYGSGAYGFQRMRVTSDGVTLQDSTGFIRGDFAFEVGLLVTALGRAFLPESLHAAGIYPGTARFGGPVVSDAAANRVYFVEQDEESPERGYRVLVFDRTTFVRLGVLSLPGVLDTPRSLVRWGDDGLAFRTTNDQLFLVRVSGLAPTTTTTSTTTLPPPPGLDMRSLALTTRDLVYDATRRRLYASVPGTDPERGNSIVTVDPETGEIEASLPVGSEPATLALSDDDGVLYVGLDGAAAVRPVDLSTRTPGMAFPVTTPEFSVQLLARDIAVMPGRSDTVAVVRRYDEGGPLDVLVYEGGRPRPHTTSSDPGPSSAGEAIAFDGVVGRKQRLYGGGGGLVRMTVDAEGVAVEDVTPGLDPGRFVLHDGRLYSSDGRVIDPERRVRAGTFPVPSFFGISGSELVEPAGPGGRVYFIRDQYPAASGYALRGFDRTTFRQVATVPLAEFIGTPDDLVRWGDHGLAFRTARDLFLVRVSETSTTTTTTSTSSTTTTPPFPSTTTTTLAPGLQVGSLALRANDLVYDPVRALIYASVPGDVPEIGNSIVAIDPAARQIVGATFAGSEPGKLAIDDAATVLYVVLAGANGIARVDLATFQVDLDFPIGNDPRNGPMHAQDLAVMPENPDVVAVTRAPERGAAIYDHGVPRPVTTFDGNLVQDWGTIRFSANGARLYTAERRFGDVALIRLNPSAEGVTVADQLLDLLDGDFDFDGERITTRSGRVVEPESGRILGAFSSGYLGSGSLLATDREADRVYALGSDEFVPGTRRGLVRIFDRGTFVQLRAVPLPISFDLVPVVGSLIRWGVDGLAFRSEHDVYLLRIADVAPPTTTTTLPPFPDLGIREYRLPTRDLVCDRHTETLYASVASSESGLGNRVVALDPVTGAVEGSVFVGSEPNKLALDDSGGTLYVSLDGPGSVRRVQLPSLTAGPEFTLGEVGFPRSIAFELAVMPGHPDVVAVVRNRRFFPDLVIYDRGVPRRFAGPGAHHLEFSSDPGRLYGSTLVSHPDRSDFQRMVVDADGIKSADATADLIGGNADVEFSDGLIYATTGEVLDPESLTLVDSFPGIPVSVLWPAPLVEPDPPAIAVYFLVSGGDFSANRRTTTLLAYDSIDYVRFDSLEIPGVSGVPTSLVRCGENRLAFRTDGQVFVVVAPGATTTTSLPTTTTTGPTSTTTTLPRIASAEVTPAPQPAKAIVVSCQLAHPTGRRPGTCEAVGVAADDASTQAVGERLTRVVRHGLDRKGRARLRLPLNRAGKRLLKTAGTLVVRVRVTIDDRNGTSETIEQDVTLVRRSR